MKKYYKPFIEDEAIEIEDICDQSNIGQQPVSNSLDEENEDSKLWPFGN